MLFLNFAVKTRKYYDFLQYAYYQIGDKTNAIQCAYTYFQYNSKDKAALHNLDFYRNNEAEIINDNLEIIKSDITDENLFLMKYATAVDYYQRMDYKNAIPLFEQVLEDYKLANNLCRNKCDFEAFRIGHEYGYGYNDPPPRLPNMEMHLIKHWIQTLECKILCTSNIAKNSIGSDSNINNFLPKVFHFLQFAYGNLNKMDKAAEAANTYNIFQPNNPVMKANLLVYKRKLGGRNNLPAPRQEWTNFLRELRIEIAYARYAHVHLRIPVSNEVYDLFPVEDGIDKNGKDRTGEEAGGDDDDEDDEDDEIDDYEDEDAKETEEDAAYDSMADKIDQIINQNGEEVQIKAAKFVKTKAKWQPTDVVKEDMFGYYAVERPDSIRISTQNPEIDNTLEKNLLHKEHDLWIGPKDTIPKLVADNSIFNHHDSIFVMDDMITESDCEALINLAEATVEIGDGYSGNKKPHNQNEVFSGVTLSAVADKVLNGEIDITYLYIYYYLAERVRRQVQIYNNLDELYQDYVHLVCRDVVNEEDEAQFQADLKKWLQDKTKYRLTQHLSHPIHSDNCKMLFNGTCERERPAYTWREYSAVVYLDDKFTGGEFILADQTGKKIIANVEAKCGRLAAFCAGKECLHGVKAIRKGRRCALAQWFTVDYSRRDMEHTKVLNLLKKNSKMLKAKEFNWEESHVEL